MVVVDDMISTGGTIAVAVRALEDAGARPGPVLAATHGLFVGDAGTARVHGLEEGVRVLAPRGAGVAAPREQAPLAALRAPNHGRRDRVIDA